MDGVHYVTEAIVKEEYNMGDVKCVRVCVFVGRVGPKNQVAKGALTQRSLTLSQSGHCEALMLPDLASKQATSCTNNNDLLTGFSLCSCSEMCYSVQHQIF